MNGTYAAELNTDHMKQTLASCPKDSDIDDKLHRSDKRIRRSGAGVAPLHSYATEDDFPSKQLEPSRNQPVVVSNPMSMVSSSHSVSFGERLHHQRSKQHIPLHNLITGTESSDTLHNENTKVCSTFNF